jgi:hypothetical protein
MEELTRLVAESMARHGIDVPVDSRPLQWSKWSRCHSSFDLLLVPTKPGLFALAEELIAPGETAIVAGKRMLAIFQVTETPDLDISLLRLFAPGNPLAARLAEGRVFVRYAVIEDDGQRHSAHASMQRWLATSADTASGVVSDHTLAVLSASEAPASQKESNKETKNSDIQAPAPLPAGF